MRNTPIVLMAVTTVGLTATFGMNFQVVIPPLAQDALGSDAAGFGFLMAASGLGCADGGDRPRASPASRGPSASRSARSCSASRRCCSPLSTSYPLSLLLMVPVGAGGIVMAATANATIQLAVPDGLRGRVMSVYTTVFSASMPIGGLLMGVLASSIGILEAIAIGGALSLLTGVVALVWWRRLGVPRRRVARRRGPSARDSRGPGVRAGARSVDRAEHQRGVQPAEPERGAQHPPIGARPARPQQARQQPVQLGLRCRRGSPTRAPSRRGWRARRSPLRSPLTLPSGWPYNAFVPLTGTVAARSPSAVVMRPRLGHVPDRRR